MQENKFNIWFQKEDGSENESPKQENIKPLQAELNQSLGVNIFKDTKYTVVNHPTHQNKPYLAKPLDYNKIENLVQQRISENLQKVSTSPKPNLTYFSKSSKTEQTPTENLLSEPSNILTEDILKTFQGEITTQRISQVKNFQIKKRGVKLQRVFWPLVLVSNLLLFAGQLCILNSFNEYKDTDTKRFSRLETTVHYYYENLQKEIDTFINGSKAAKLPPINRDNSPNHSVTPKIKQSFKKNFSSKQKLAESTLELNEFPQEIYEQPLKIQKANTKQPLAKLDEEDFSVIKPRQEDNNETQFSIMTDSEYSQYETIKDIKQAKNKNKQKFYSYEQENSLYKNRAPREQ